MLVVHLPSALMHKLCNVYQNFSDSLNCEYFISKALSKVVSKIVCLKLF